MSKSIGDEAGIDLSIDATTGAPESAVAEPRETLRLRWYGHADRRNQLLDSDGNDLLDLLPVMSIGFEIGRTQHLEIVIRLMARSVKIEGDFR